jgi:hypothetical protein
VLAPDPGQPARVHEAEPAVQGDRGVAAGVGNDRDDLPVRAAGALPVTGRLRHADGTGVGGHVDHILVRTAAQSSGAPVAYYSDFPGNRRDTVVEAFIYRHDLVAPDGLSRPRPRRS